MLADVNVPGSYLDGSDLRRGLVRLAQRGVFPFSRDAGEKARTRSPRHALAWANGYRNVTRLALPAVTTSASFSRNHALQQHEE